MLANSSRAYKYHHGKIQLLYTKIHCKLVYIYVYGYMYFFMDMVLTECSYS